MAYQILDSLEQLQEKFARFALGQLCLLNNKVEQLASWRELQDQIHGIGFVECVLETQYVRMTDTHQHGNLLLKTLILGSLFHPGCLGEHFDGISLSRRLLHT